ncbi:predicted hydrolase or acyltransferase of alpha/beta superfamily [Sanguibacter keddieii DSM 10542]|uniref:Predicted hydrolase or acyltransferase of alpha/beta superfamily n=1 Tax=Sanguibacter keddieii (strain ATCC 51767 / DSM 10542 / NCFB 3025 / ST-74) TaxID=446469 RepID=D1BGF4_SANKS|nr:alpha/beta hydrolase [Sanguibacter keddieii]ACZ23671.1 predicted hydrolase or acyltransferase of alpha/beta superfamily [Sanguibacter keddieii DSM 10542]
MKKSAKRALVAVAAVGAVVVLGLTTTTVVNAVASARESDRVEAYGQTVTVDGRHMNVQVTGQGPDVVLLPGFGTASPVLDFAPLVADLSTDHRVIVVEPFGYGLSDGTDVERTTENIVSEVHEALQQLDVDRYVLMGHSIAGIYGLEYTTRYRDEVTAFVGIDSSVPGQPGMDASFPTGLLGAAKTLGLARVVTAVAGDGLDGTVYPDEAREQMRMIGNRTSLSSTYLDEMSHISTNFEDALGRTFPEDLPLLLLVVEHNEKNPDWLGLHERQAASVADGTVVPLDGDHYLHHTLSPEIAETFRGWAATRPEAG